MAHPDPQEVAAFGPLDGGATGFVNSVTVAATNASSAVTAIPGGTSGNPSTVANNPLYYRQIQIANQAAAWAYVNCGTTAVAAATVAGSYPVAPNSVVVISINGASTSFTVILASGTGSVTVTRGQGM